MSTKKFRPSPKKKIIDTQPINRKEVLLLAIFVGHKTFKKFKDKQFICFYWTNFLVNISHSKCKVVSPPGSSTTDYKACKKFGYIFFDTFSFFASIVYSLQYYLKGKIVSENAIEQSHPQPMLHRKYSFLKLIKI